MQKRKLQVFVSSTYLDLKKERQAAVEAILSAGHIPAGMELFAAGDQSQWAVIQDWIDRSDVYMLILGGRYGSIEPESGKSYTQLEYEFAIEKGKPFFAVVIKEEKLAQKVKEEGLEVVEREHHAQLQHFRSLVQSKTVRFWDDIRDIKLAIHETLNEYARRDDLIGWIPGNQGVNGAELAEEIARLTKENASFREKIDHYESMANELINNQPVEKFIEILELEMVDEKDFKGMYDEYLALFKKIAGDNPLNLFHVFCCLSEIFDGTTNIKLYPSIRKLSLFGIIKLFDANTSYAKCEFTNDGSKLYIYLKRKQLIQTLPAERKRSGPIAYTTSNK